MDKPALNNMFHYADELGPARIIHVHEPGCGLKGILVIDNVAMGPSIGGLRMAEDVSTGECFRLARAMTLKNSAAGLRHGGGNSVLFGDPKMPRERKEKLIRAMACTLADEQDYIFGPDMGTDEECMAWVHDEIGRAVGQIGEICFRGYHLMRCYYGDEAATRKTVDETGWLHSGDLGVMDKDGYVSITGRLKDMIIRGGENIYPREIEDFLFTHPKIVEVAVFGVPDEYYGEEIAAWIQLHAGTTATEQEIRDYCQGRIAHYKIPKYIRIVTEFPTTVTGKLQKFRMREIETS